MQTDLRERLEELVEELCDAIKKRDWSTLALSADRIQAILDAEPAAPVGELREKLAKALCKHAYAGRDFDEAVSPSRKLWERMLPEVDAILPIIAAHYAAPAPALNPDCPWHFNTHNEPDATCICKRQPASLTEVKAIGESEMAHAQVVPVVTVAAPLTMSAEREAEIVALRDEYRNSTPYGFPEKVVAAIDDLKRELDATREQRDERERLLNAASEAAGLPPDTFKIAPCDVLAHQIKGIASNATRFFDQWTQVESTLAATRERLERAETELARRSRR